MKLDRKLDKILLLATVFLISLTVGMCVSRNTMPTFAEGEDMVFVESEEHFVTFFDNGEKLTVKTDAVTVGEALERAGITVNASDIVEPKVTTVIDMNNFYVNIYRSRPAVVKDGVVEHYVMTASYDPRRIAEDAGVTVYDGDEIELARNVNFLETGAAEMYVLTRNGGRTVTVEEEVPFGETEVYDYNLASGTREVRSYGEVGAKTLTYEVMYVDGVEAARELVSEVVTREPVDRVVAVGAKKSVRPEWETCANWARQAGVSEDVLGLALDLIYHESGCRVDARNASTGAYGIPQALPGSKMASAGADWETNPVTQIRWMTGYVTGRYGGWAQAVEFWYSHGWY